MAGTLVGDRVRVTAQSEGDRLHSKGRYGRPLSGGGLDLDLLEAAYLCEVERLDVQTGTKALDWAQLLTEASRLRPGFEVDYLAYRDLRERGYVVRAGAARDLQVWPKGSDRSKAPDVWLRPQSERDTFSFASLHSFANEAEKKGVAARVALVDEESDLTYYQLTTRPPHGTMEPTPLGPVDATLLADRVLVQGAQEVKRLHGVDFYGRPVGEGLQLSLVESAYLASQGALVIRDAKGKALAAPALQKRMRTVEPQLDLRLRVYEDLRQRGLVVKTGFKFGTHFRAYDKQPQEEHAPYLVQAIPPRYEGAWEPIARAVRLSHSVRKSLYFATPGEEEIAYLSFGRYRP